MGSEAPPDDLTAQLKHWRTGPPADHERLLCALHDELRRIAGAYMRRERPDHTLQPTALVHEAYLRLIKAPQVAWDDRVHFFGIAARVMRQILVDHRLQWDKDTSGVVTAADALRLLWVDDRFLVELPQENGRSVRFVPDSGTDVIVVFVRPGRRMLQLDVVFNGAELRGVGSRSGARIGNLRQLMVGATTLKDRPAAIVERSAPDVPDYDGLLPLHMFASVSFNSFGRYLVVRHH